MMKKIVLDPKEVKYFQTVLTDRRNILVMYVGRGLEVEELEVLDALDRAMMMNHPRIMVWMPEGDEDPYESLRAYKGIGVFPGERTQTPLEASKTVKESDIKWVHYGGDEPEVLLEADELLLEEDWDTFEELLIQLVEIRNETALSHIVDELGIGWEDTIEPLKEYPYLQESLDVVKRVREQNHP